MRVTLLRDPQLLPDASLTGPSPLATLCHLQALSTLRAAAAFVQSLPYGRNHSRSDSALVLAEGRGTCSSKHAFLAELADEVGVDLGLTLGIYRLSGETDPKAAPVLRAHGIGWVPEAHCYLSLGDRRVDLTGHGPTRHLEILHEERIAPHQVAAYKPRVHRRFVDARAAEIGVDADALWATREACIAALSA